MSIQSPLLEGSRCVRYGSFHCGIFLIRIAYKITVSRGENIQLGRLFRQLRNYVL